MNITCTHPPSSFLNNNHLLRLDPFPPVVSRAWHVMCGWRTSRHVICGWRTSRCFFHLILPAPILFRLFNFTSLSWNRSTKARLFSGFLLVKMSAYIGKYTGNNTPPSPLSLSVFDYFEYWVFKKTWFLCTFLFWIWYGFIWLLQ